MHAHGTGPAPSPAQALLTLRIIGGSLGLGVTLFAFVAWFLHQQGPTGDPATRPPGDPNLMFNIMLATAVAAVLTAIAFWRARVTPLIDRADPEHDWFERFARIQTQIIIVWALIEGPALFAVVLYYLHDMAIAGVLGVIMIWTGLALTWPKREWLDAGR